MPSLFLHAVGPQWAPESMESLAGVLNAMGLTGGELSASGADEFRAGESFLNLVMFLGCSPQVELDPDSAPPGTPFCYLQLHCSDETGFLCAEKRPQPRCRQCRAPVEKLPELSAEAVYVCPACAGSTLMPGLDWRRAGGFGRCFIEVHGIYPQEAVPADKLLATLEAFSGCGWDYFYI